MRIAIKMPAALRPYYEKELRSYVSSIHEGALHMAWRHLEKAHVIGQAYPFEHSAVHWKMLLFGIRIKSAKEVFGQLPRLALGGIKSFVGTIPVGNTGGANVPPLKVLPIEKEIVEIFHKAGVPLPK